MVRAAPDGYTLMVAPTSVETANPSLFNADFHPAKDLTPVGSIGVTAMYIVAKPDITVKNAKELVDYAKANPGKQSCASSGAGTPPHLAAELRRRVRQSDSASAMSPRPSRASSRSWRKCPSNLATLYGATGA